jgi:hypothetical protein
MKWIIINSFNRLKNKSTLKILLIVVVIGSIVLFAEACNLSSGKSNVEKSGSTLELEVNFKNPATCCSSAGLVVVAANANNKRSYYARFGRNESKRTFGLYGAGWRCWTLWT